MLRPAAIADFKKRLRGTLLAPADPNYDVARRVWNGMIDKRPALIAQCSATSDVVACIEFARAESVPVSVRGGGHSFAGKAVCDGGLMIDLSGMKGIEIDTSRRTALAQTGLKLGEFDRETQRHGLVTPLGVATTTGISGLTLGGGYGWLVGKYGLACDNVIRIEVVTADGKTLECSAAQNPELFWGMRGAGANFGIAVQIEYRLHPLTTIFGGPLIHPLTPDTVRFYAEFSSGIPDDLTTFGAAMRLPDGTPAWATVICYCGSSKGGEELIQPLRRFAPPIVDMIQERPYLEMQSLFDPDYPPGRRYYNKAHILRRFAGGAIDATLRFAATMPPRPSSIGFQQLHGAATRVSASATAFPHRYDHHVAWISPVEDTASQDDAIVRWARECWDALCPHVDRAVYVNALDDAVEEDDLRVRQAYGENYQRLKDLKKQYDPTNLFRQNSNIRPD
jgi:FAD binding domain/Berberine and berberine like